MNRLSFSNATAVFFISALTCLVVADIAVTTLSPWAEMRRLLAAILRPDILSIEVLAIVYTVAFAVLGVGIAAVLGFGLAIVYPKYKAIRVVCVIIRSIHELFWALLLIQVFGLSPITGILAIALPYTGVFAKVYSEMIEEADLAAERVLPVGTSAVSAFAYARLPELA